MFLLLFASAMQAPTAPRVDSHQHLFSPKVSAMITQGEDTVGVNARRLVQLLDSAGIERAVVLSVAYTWASANRPQRDDEYARVKEENDWTAAQVAQYPKRLTAFCSVNPLKSWAIAEIERCSKNRYLRNGLKLHVGNSDVDLEVPAHVKQLRDIFATANRKRMPIVVHMRTSNSKRRAYGEAQARTFLNEVLPAASNIPVQIAHLAGSGGYDLKIDSALAVFVDAIKRNDPRVKNVWYDVTTIVRPDATAEDRALYARRIRELGVKRVLYGSDGAFGGNLPPHKAWPLFRTIPLSEQEFHQIATNKPPHIR